MRLSLGTGEADLEATPKSRRHEENPRIVSSCFRGCQSATLGVTDSFFAFQFVPQDGQLTVISLRIPVIDELAIVRVRRPHARGVPDWAPVLLGPPRNLTHVRETSIGVSAVHAIELFDGVNEFRDALLQAFVGPPHIAFEADATGLDSVPPVVAGSIQLSLNLPLELCGFTAANIAMVVAVRQALDYRSTA